MVLRSRGEPLHVTLEGGRVTDIAGRLGGAGERYLFTGIYVVEPAFLRRIRPRTKISVIPLFMEMIKEGGKLGGVVLDEGSWWDLGTRERYLEVHEAVATGDFFGDGREWRRPMAGTARVAAEARLGGFVVAGEGAEIEGAEVRDCILWEGARVAAGSKLERCVVTSGRTAAGEHRGVDF
jgi:NDP-sugar pyrophosphorylase family protein